MRADRLIALLLLLQTRDRITAAEVAVELEVSERTARRDLEALAMRKLSGALPETFRADAEAASTAVKVDPSGWGQISRSQPTHLNTLIDAVIRGVTVSLDYVSPRSGASTRIVHPLGLVTKRGVWYLVANTDAGLRTFRVGRVRHAEVIGDPVTRPDGFDLEREWDRIVSEVESRRGGMATELIVDNTVLTHLHFQFRGRAEVGEPFDDNRTRVRVSEESAGGLAAQLAGFGSSITLLDPPDELRHELRRIAEELATQWIPAEVD